MSAGPIELEPREGAHDADVQVTNAAAVAIDCEVTWSGARGRYEARVAVPPGRHDAEEIGLFRELSLVDAAAGAPSLRERLAPVRVTVQGGGSRVELTRAVVPEGVDCEIVEKDGLRAVLFRPRSLAHSMAVVCLTGSSGGYALESAGTLAGRGFTTLALAYFGAPGVPADLVEIPLEYLERGIAWLAERAGAARIAVLGSSKGGELALLLGATFPSVSGVVAYVPSSQTHAWGTPARFVACWTHRGQPLPWTPLDYTRNFRAEGGRLAIRPGYESTLEDPAEVERTAIPVERTRGPILLISGERDLMWPSSEFASRVVRRARERGFGHEVRHLCYPEAGHVIGVPNQPRRPSAHDFFEHGGSTRANTAASRASWPEVVAFLAALRD